MKSKQILLSILKQLDIPHRLNSEIIHAAEIRTICTT